MWEIKESLNKAFPYLIIDENGGNVAMFVYMDDALKALEFFNKGRG
jgi:hypothetical protein